MHRIRLNVRARPARLGAVVALVGLVAALDASGQVVRVEQAGDGDTFAFEITWGRTLRAALDSAGVERLRPGDLNAVGGGLVEADHRIEIGSAGTPHAELVSSSSESERVDLADGVRATDLIPLRVRVEGIGIMRGRRVGALVVPVFRYDPTTRSLHRMDRVVVRVTTAGPVARAAGMAAENPHLLVDRSVLADGTVLRIPITEEGVYRIGRSLIEAAGLDPDTIDPDGIRVYGNGGRPVPALNSADRYADLVENPVTVTGGGDGRFDGSDAVVFHADGPRGWTLEEGEWTHFVHPFSNENAIFVKVASPDGARVPVASFPGESGVPILDRVEGRYFRDIEEQVWSKEHGSGHDWMSNTIRSGGSRTLFESVVPPGFTGGTVRYRARVAIASNPRATVAFVSGSDVLAEKQAPTITVRGAEFPSAAAAVVDFTQDLPAGGSLNLSMRLLEQTNEPEAAIDWVRVFYDQELRASNGRLRFVTPRDRTGPMEFRLAGFATEPRVWDVTRPDGVRALTPVADGGLWRIQLTRAVGEPPREIVAFEPSAVVDAPADGVSTVPNQNLHGIGFYPDLVIVTPEAFLEAAGELADLRRADGLEVLVATVPQVYNEFSGGIPDMRAARDLFRFLYDRAPDDASRLRYALLFGDGHYDYRGLAAGGSALENWVFPYETETSLFTDGSFTSDDYFGLLDADEGIWTYTTYGAVSTERMDIGVGRLPAQSPQEAAMLVDKIRRYESMATFGTWRSLYTFVADDGPTGLSGQQDDADLHLQNVDQVAELIRLGIYPEMNVRKIYAESYERVFLNGFKIPEAHDDIVSALNSGTLLINYSGHGGPDGLAQEEIFTKEDAVALTNSDRLAVFITATCSFGWWDLADEQSGAEALLLNPDGGAVALMTTVRLVYTSGDTTSLNAGLNRALNIELFRKDPDGLPRRLGDVMLDTKNTRVGLQGNSRKFNLLGDPSMRIGLPGRRVGVDALNGVPLEDLGGRMRALDRVTITGTVFGEGGSPDTGYDGLVTLTVFDATRNVPLVKQVRMPTPYYTVREDLIWRGEVQASAGAFEASFVVPKDISYSDRPGRISAYAVDGDAQALGYNEEFVVGGTSDSPPDDDQGPQIRLFLNDTTFVSGGMVAPDPELIVRLFDESGMNTVGAGVGHEMLLTVDADDERAEDIGAQFRSDAGSYRRGEVRWPLAGLAPGPHSVSVRAWDVLNNASTAEISFVVVDDEVLRLRNVYNYPNPMNRETRFVFEHNQPPGTPAEIDIRVYSLSGRPVRTIPSEEALPSGILGAGPVQVSWDGRDDDFDRVATGIYLYRVRVQVNLADGRRQTAESIEKLAVIR